VTEEKLLQLSTAVRLDNTPAATTTTTTICSVQSIARLAATAEMLRYRAELPGFLSALRERKVLPLAIVNDLAAKTKEPLEHDYKLSEVEAAVGGLRASLSGLSPDDMQVRREIES
jgi:hypothetical protein